MGIIFIIVLVASIVFGINKLLFNDASKIKLMFVSAFFIMIGISILLIFHDVNENIKIIPNIISYIFIYLGSINGITVLRKL